MCEPGPNRVELTVIDLRRAALPALFVLVGCGPAPAQEVEYSSRSGPIRLVTVARGLENPWGLAFLPDGRMLVTERAMADTGVISQKAM